MRLNKIKLMLRWVLGLLYKVDVSGLENAEKAGDKVLIVANHASFLDAILLAAFLPGRITFAVDSFIANAWYMRPIKFVVELFPMNPGNALSIKSLVKRVARGGQVAIFPEGRITVTGALMKIYPGPGLVAVKTGASILPVRIDGAQYTPFSRMRGRVRIRWFPKITLTILPPQTIKLPEQIRGRARRQYAGRLLSDSMTRMMFESSDYRRTLMDVLLDARNIHGGKHIIMEDVERRPMSYQQLLTRVIVLGDALAKITQRGEHVGVLLPSSIGCVVTLFGLLRGGRIPAMLNFTVGAKGMLTACRTAQIKTVLTSRRFVSKGKLDDAIVQLAKDVSVVYLEDLAKEIRLTDKLSGWWRSHFDYLFAKPYSDTVKPTDPAVVLFTSGSEGVPKGVVLSHQNLLANRAQLAAKVDFHAQDIVLNSLPLFHSFGLTAGTLLPVLSGMRTFLYPSPLHYRVIPEIAYTINATLLFGTNTFLAGYARYAHEYDFNSIRYVFAGAEKLKDEVRRLWESKYGVRVFEGYGATETSPVLAANSPMESRPGTVGKLLPSVEAKLEPVENLPEGRRLYVKGPNIMLGYYFYDQPGQLVPPQTQHGPGWYDTGDIVQQDEQGFISILGRAKRFAKIAGEMVSLVFVESLVSRTWPNAQHAVLSAPDSQKGEQLILLTTEEEAVRAPIVAQARQDKIGEIHVPRKIIYRKAIPLLGTGKVDYTSAQQLVNEAIGI